MRKIYVSLCLYHREVTYHLELLLPEMNIGTLPQSNVTSQLSGNSEEVSNLLLLKGDQMDGKKGLV